MSDVNDAQFDALITAVEQEGTVECDGLQVIQTSHDSTSEDDPEGDGADDGVFRFVTPEREFEGLAVGEVRAVAEENPWLVSNWYYWQEIDRPPAEQAFLRWLEAADDRTVSTRYEHLVDGVHTPWGQLAITITLGDHGHRQYTVTHEADADTDTGDLDVYTDPHAAEDFITRDDDGRYRPLKTAPTLPTGWAFVDLDGRSLARTVDIIYPATIANWHREQHGELDISHWRETMARQTGIYGVIETWDRGDGHEHVNWVAEACCADTECLKRREWQYDDDTPLDVPGGEGVFPCREPCSLVISAARTWTKLEGETPRSYEFELTPSEKEQVEAIITAVADDQTDAIREADFTNPANRWRARYLRAKRFDNGTLTETTSHNDDTNDDDDGGG